MKTALYLLLPLYGAPKPLILLTPNVRPFQPHSSIIDFCNKESTVLFSIPPIFITFFPSYMAAVSVRSTLAGRKDMLHPVINLQTFHVLEHNIASVNLISLSLKALNNLSYSQ